VKDRINNIITKENLEILILNNRKKKRRLKKTLILQTENAEIIENKLSKNWKSKKEKHPYKEVCISLKFLGIKELNKLKRKMKIMKSIRKK
jgi:hypothetical protein